MRSDFDSVIIDRPRTGSQYTKNLKGLRKELRDLEHDRVPVREGGLQKKYGWNRKNQTDLLGPLKRFLQKNVGRPWDKIYSEICAQVDQRTLRGSHFLDHEGYFYVHPKNGLLCVVPKEKKYIKERKDKNPHKWVGDLEGYWYIDGLWYKLTFEKYETRNRCIGGVTRLTSNYGKDVLADKSYIHRSVLYRSCEEEFLKRRYGKLVVAITKKQSSKKEILYNDLRNLE